jgi:hypothetical protein
MYNQKMAQERLDRIEELKNKLFNKSYKTKPASRLGFAYGQKKDVPDSWEEEEKKGEAKDDSKGKFFLKTSTFKKFFIFSVVFFVLALGFACYIIFSGGNTVSNDNIDMSVLSDASVAGGEPFPIQVEIVNRNSSPLELADLVVEYPQSSSDNSSGGTGTIRTSLGTIPAGGTQDENIKIVLFGEQGSVQDLKISLEYRVEGSNAIFVKEEPYEVTISSTPINLSINAPDEANPNQEISLNVKATLNSTEPLSNVLLSADYPIGFEFESATPAPSFGNNVWAFGSLSPGVVQNIEITGKMVDVSDGEEKDFRVSSGSESDSDKSSIGTVFNSLEHKVMIKEPFVEADLYINGVYQSEYAASSSTPVSGEIRWANNLTTKVNDLQISAKFSGNAYDPTTVSATDGFFDSSDDTITWDKNTKEEFAEVNPGDSGSVLFSFSPLALFSAAGGLLSQPVVNIDVSVKGSNALEGNATQEIDNSESKVVSIISDANLDAKALYYSGAFTNTGPIPPAVGQKTTYTVVWTLSNTSNNISNAQVHSTLPSWMSFVGSVSPSTEDLTYDSLTNEIVWNVGEIPPGTGITTTGRSVSFQISFTPSLSQAGTAPVIINDAVLTGHDDFANVDITVNKNSLDTTLLEDPTFPALGDRVVN